MNQIGSFVGRLTSRKFVLTVFLMLSLMAVGEYGLAVTVVSAFIAAEGVGDAASRYGQATASVATETNKVLLANDPAAPDDDIDTSTIVTGRDYPLPSPTTTGGVAPL